MNSKEIRVYAFGELPPGTELVTRSAYDKALERIAELEQENAELRAKLNSVDPNTNPQGTPCYRICSSEDVECVCWPGWKDGK